MHNDLDSGSGYVYILLFIILKVVSSKIKLGRSRSSFVHLSVKHTHLNKCCVVTVVLQQQRLSLRRVWIGHVAIALVSCRACVPCRRHIQPVK